MCPSSQRCRAPTTTTTCHSMFYDSFLRLHRQKETIVSPCSCVCHSHRYTHSLWTVVFFRISHSKVVICFCMSVGWHRKMYNRYSRMLHKKVMYQIWSLKFCVCFAFEFYILLVDEDHRKFPRGDLTIPDRNVRLSSWVISICCAPTRVWDVLMQEHSGRGTLAARLREPTSHA